MTRCTTRFIAHFLILVLLVADIAVTFLALWGIVGLSWSQALWAFVVFKAVDFVRAEINPDL